MRVLKCNFRFIFEPKRRKQHFFFSDLSFKDADTGCVFVVVGFKSLSAVSTLIEDRKNGNLQRYFLPIQDALHKIPEYVDFTLTVDIPTNDYITFLNDLGICYSKIKKGHQALSRSFKY